MATLPGEEKRQKQVLVHLEKRIREVSFQEESRDGHESLLRAVRATYSDVLQGDEELVLQIKREEWAGQFTDLVGEVPDQSVLKAVILIKEQDKPGPSRLVEVSVLISIYYSCSLRNGWRAGSAASPLQCSRSHSHTTLGSLQWCPIDCEDLLDLPMVLCVRSRRGRFTSWFHGHILEWRLYPLSDGGLC